MKTTGYMYSRRPCNGMCWAMAP